MEAFSFSTQLTDLKAALAGFDAGPGRGSTRPSCAMRHANDRAEALYRDCLISLEFAACTGRALFLYR
ncbi:hypothetical protein BSY238_2218 [Methyloversatilis sp. RAC08]|nr:hypothetical protein BSY238_2218 [Methyloversatilis sp. RAC08]